MYRSRSVNKGRRRYYFPTIKPFFRLCDFWVGFYFDRESSILYWIPVVPCFGLRFDFKRYYRVETIRGDDTFVVGKHLSTDFLYITDTYYDEEVTHVEISEDEYNELEASGV